MGVIWASGEHAFIQSKNMGKKNKTKIRGGLLGPPSPPSAQAPCGLSVGTVPLKFLDDFGFTASQRFLWFPGVFWELDGVGTFQTLDL